MTGETREKLRAQLMEDEGFVPHAYLDSLGYLTIGHGICIDERKGGGITVNESALLAGNRIGNAIRALQVRCAWFDGLDDVRQAVIVQMAYNLGAGGVAGFRQMIAALERRDYATAAVEMLSSRWSEQVGPRATRLATMMASGRWPT
jgi:lysozyme